jgi:glycosyltransferase involved in cell wall biosynthesis
MNSWDLICFANDWNADPLSKKQVMTRLAQKHRILWINSINNRRPQLASKDFRRAFQKLSGFRRGLIKVGPQIWVLTPLYLPFHGVALVRTLNRWLLGWQIRQATRRLGFKKPVTWTFIPNSADVVRTLGESCVVYHCVDEYGAFTDAGNEVPLREKELLLKSDLVITCSDYLQKSKKQINPSTHLVTHGVDFAHFSRAATEAAPLPPELSELPRPILGFHGLLADWVDLRMVAEIASSRPNWSIVLIGRSETDMSPIRGLSNVHWLGHRPYERLPEYLRGFDFAILPFVCNELTFNSNPLKLREYLAAGLPVISAPLPEAAKFDGQVMLARTAGDYIHLVEQSMEKGEVGPSKDRSLAMASESWDYKVHEMETLLAAALAEKGFSIADGHATEAAAKALCEN